MAGEVLSGPVTASHDGWTLQSSSKNAPSAAELQQALGVDETPPASAEVPPADVPAVEPVAAVVTEPATEEVPAVEAVPEVPAAAAAVRPKKNDPQRRIADLTAQLAAERERNAAIDARLAALEKPAAAPVVAPPAAPVGDPMPVWDGPEGYEAQGKSWETYQQDRDSYRDKQVQELARAEAKRITDEHIAASRTQTEADQQKAREESARNTVLAAHETRVAAARTAHPDFDAVVEKNLADFRVPYFNHMAVHHADGGELLYHVGHMTDAQRETLASFEPTRPMVDALTRSRHGKELLTYFAEHPAEVLALQTNPDPIAVLLEIGRMDALRGPGAPAASPVPARVSKAAPPVRAVTGAPAVTAAVPAKNVDDMEFGPEYVAQANRLERQARASRMR